MDKKLNPLDWEIDLLWDTVSDIIRKLNPLTWRLELVYSANSYIQKINPFIWDFDIIWGTGAAHIHKTVTGNGYADLTNAIAWYLTSVKLYGWTEQASTPTPTTPVDIVCNNGALKVKDSELPAWYKRLLWYTCNNDVLWQITDFHLRGSDTIRISFSVTTACNVFGCYQWTDANDNYDLYVSTGTGSKYLRYGKGTYASYWSSANLWERFDVAFTPTWTTWMPEDSTWTPKTFESANDLLIGATTLTSTSSKLKWNLYGSIIVDWRLNLIPCERLSDNSLWYYDTYSDTFFEPTGTPTSLWYDYTYTPEIYIDWTTETIEITGKNLNGGGELDNKGYTSTGSTSTSTTFCGTLWKIKVKEGEKYTLSYGNFPDGISGVFVNTWKTDGTWNLRQAISIGSPYTYTIPSGIGEVNFTLYKTGGIAIASNSWLQVEKGETATEYEPYYSGGTATAETLLKIWDYADEQEILSWNIIRKVGYKIFDWTESFTASTAYGKACLVQSAAGNWGAIKYNVLCTHFKGLPQTSWNQPDYTCFFNASGHFYFRLEDNTVATFKQWLADQYAAWTPVIVFFALSTETTETVAWQTLHIQNWNNTVKITQASIDDLPLEVHYDATE